MSATKHTSDSKSGSLFFFSTGRSQHLWQRGDGIKIQVAAYSSVFSLPAQLLRSNQDDCAKKKCEADKQKSNRRQHPSIRISARQCVAEDEQAGKETKAKGQTGGDSE
jgi:hypothetical protein